MKKNIKNQRGAVSIFVLMSMMFFLAFMLGAFTLVNRRNAAQVEALSETQKIYATKTSAKDYYNSIFANESSIVQIRNSEQLHKVKYVYDNNLEEKYLIDGKIYTYKKDAKYALGNNITLYRNDYQDFLKSVYSDCENYEEFLRNVYKYYISAESPYNIDLNGYTIFYERYNGTIGKLEKFINSDAAEIATDNRNIGKAVNYGKSYTTPTGTSSDWEILYADENNVYIITKDVLPRDNLEAINESGSGYNGTSDFTNLDTTKYPAVADGWLYKIYSDGSVIYDGGNNKSIKAMQYLLNSTNIRWSGLKNNYAKWVIGGPTLELLVASYNAVNTSVQVEIGDLNNRGYPQVLIDGTLPNKSTSDNPYYPWNHGENYWLSTPSSEYENFVRTVNVAFKNVSNEAYGNSSAFRPVVCLNSDVILHWNTETNKYDIVEY